jgi:transposase-like protein
MAPDARKKTLQDIIRGKVALESLIHSDGWRGYNGLVDVGYDTHYRVHHGSDEFARGSTHINGIESFWSYAIDVGTATVQRVQAHPLYPTLKRNRISF